MSTPEPTSPGDVVRQAVGGQRRNALLMLLAAAVTAILTASLYYAIDRANDQQEAKERAQKTAEYCAQKGVSKPECKEEISKGEKGDPGPPGPGATAEEIREQVDDYFTDHPIEVPGVDITQLRAEVASYLTANPPAPGRPPTPREIAEEVARQLRANPPPAGIDGEDGTDGVDGLSWTDVRLTPECRLVFTRSDGVERTVGPVCGKDGADGADGPPGPPGVVAVVDNCNPPAGDVVTDSGINYDPATQTVTLTCTSTPQVLPKAVRDRALAAP